MANADYLNNLLHERVECPTCHGRGTDVHGAPCPGCGGSGMINQRSRFGSVQQNILAGLVLFVVGVALVLLFYFFISQ